MLAQSHNAAEIDSCTSARLRKMIVLAIAIGICANTWIRPTNEVCSALVTESPHFHRQCSSSPGCVRLGPQVSMLFHGTVAPGKHGMALFLSILAWCYSRLG